MICKKNCKLSYLLHSPMQIYLMQTSNLRRKWYVTLWYPGFIIFQQELEPCPLDWWTTIHKKSCIEKFQHYHVCHHSWKTVGTFFSMYYVGMGKLLFSSVEQVQIEVRVPNLKFGPCLRKWSKMHHILAQYGFGGIVWILRADFLKSNKNYFLFLSQYLLWYSTKLKVLTSIFWKICRNKSKYTLKPLLSQNIVHFTPITKSLSFAIWLEKVFFCCWKFAVYK